MRLFDGTSFVLWCLIEMELLLECSIGGTRLAEGQVLMFILKFLLICLMIPL